MAVSLSNVPEVFSLLRNSLDGDQTLRDRAVLTLSLYKGRPGFCSCLMDIITGNDPAFHADVRLAASIYLKNTIKDYWRSGGICNAEKLLLRNQLLCPIQEVDDQIARVLTSLILKIARMDYPRDWPELFSDLAKQLEEPDILTSHRIFRVLSCFIRKLARDFNDTRKLEEISSHLYNRCWEQWMSDVQSISQNFSSAQCFSMNTLEQQVLRLTCERWVFCTNIVLQLILLGFKDNTVKDRAVKEMCSGLLKAVDLFRPFYSKFHEAFCQKEIHEARPKLVFIRRACVRLMDFLIHMRIQFPHSFSDRTVLKSALEICLDEIMNLEHRRTPEQFLIKCMIMVKSVLEWKRCVLRVVGNVSVQARKAMIMKKNISKVVSLLLPSELVKDLCKLLIKRYLLLTNKDLEEWSQNAEAFYYKQINPEWTKKKLRPYAGDLLIVLFDNHSELLGPFVRSILCEATNDGLAEETNMLSKMLLREAAYTAVGHLCYRLSGILNFNDWLQGVLRTELRDDHPFLPIILKKVAFILGKSVLEIGGDMKIKVFSALIWMLSYEDLAVRLEACQSLSNLVRKINFQEEGITDLLSQCLDMCFKLLKEAGDFRSKANALELFICITEHVGKNNIPCECKLADFFLKVWVETTGSSDLQRHVLEDLCDIINKFGTQSPFWYILLLPMLKLYIRVNNSDELDLLKNGMLLWEITISNAPLMVPQLLEFFPYLPAVMEKSFYNFRTKVDNNFDHFKVAIKIFEGYINMGKREVLSKHASVVAQLLGVFETLVQEFPEDVPPLIRNILQKLIVIILSGGDDCDPSVKAIVGAILARLLVMDTSYLVHLTSEPSFFVALQQAGVYVDHNIIFCIANLWIDEIGNMTASQREICALALSIVLTFPDPQVHDNFDQILSVCLSVLLCGCEDVNGDDSSENASSMPSLETVRADVLRRKKIKYADPAPSSVRKFLKYNLEKRLVRHGFNATKCIPTIFGPLQVGSDLSPSESTSDEVQELKTYMRKRKIRLG